MKGRKKVLKVERDLDDETEQLFDVTFSLMEEVNSINKRLERLEKNSIRIKVFLLSIVVLIIILSRLV